MLLCICYSMDHKHIPHHDKKERGVMTIEISLLLLDSIVLLYLFLGFWAGAGVLRAAATVYY
jgi:hypothetical protein